MFIGIYVFKIIQRRLHPEFMYVNWFKAAGMPAPALVRSDTPPPPSGSHVMRSDTPPPPCRDNRRNTRPAGSRDCRSTPINLCKSIFYFFTFFSSFGHFFPDPPGGPGGCGSGFVPWGTFLSEKFLEKKNSYFFCLYNDLFRPFLTIFDHIWPFRALPGTYFHIFNVF